MVIRKPRYYDTFRCAAGACPDSCCQAWEVQVDSDAARRYRALPGPLGDELREALRTEDGETLMTLREGRCPMWRNDGLCRIQAELGEDALCKVCRTFPRLRHDYGDFRELMLEMSCPEAAKWILEDAGGWVETEITDPGEAGYDREDMALLLASRQRAMELLADGSLPGQTLARLLLLGIQVQNALDGGEAGEISLEEAREAAEPGDIRQIAAFFRELEILTPRWVALLDTAACRPLPPGVIPMARYLVNRYWLQAVSDLDLYGRVKFIVLSALLVGSLAGDFGANAQLWSKEIENDPENLDAILDGAYHCAAFTDSRLLGLLLK